LANDKVRVGFVGVGHMGKGMAGNLIRKGFQVTAYDLSKAAMREAEALGAKTADSPKSVAQQSDVMATSLTTLEAFEAVVLGQNGLITGSRTGQVIIDLGTTDPGTVRRVAEITRSNGVQLLDAPVSGGMHAAEAGTLTLMIGGDKESFERCRAIFDSIGKTIYYVGRSGNGATVKLVNNIMTLVNIVTFTEALALGAKCGVEAQELFDVIKNSSGSSRIFERKWVEHILKDNYEPGFKVDLAYKDLGLALKMGKEQKLPLFMTSMAEQVYELARFKGLSEKDTTGLILLLEELGNFKMRPKNTGKN